MRLPLNFHPSRTSEELAYYHTHITTYHELEWDSAAVPSTLAELAFEDAARILFPDDTQPEMLYVFETEIVTMTEEEFDSIIQTYLREPIEEVRPIYPIHERYPEGVPIHGYIIPGW
jgi:hypothetical protein